MAQTLGEKLPRTDINNTTIQNILGFIFGLAGAIAFLVIIIAGLRYTLSRGDPAAIKQSKETIIYAIVGLIIAVSGFGIVTFVFGGLR
jgi:hypothetical protein